MALTLDKYIEDLAFNYPTIVEMYSVVEDARRTLGFSTPDNNQVIIAQAEYVTQQFRKFISTLREEILDMAQNGDAMKLYLTLIEQRRNLDSYPKEEKTALYYTVRDVWLTQLIQYIEHWIQTEGHVEMNEEDVDV